MSFSSTITPASAPPFEPGPQIPAFWDPASEEPIRAEAYSLESLEVYARQLARAAVEPDLRSSGILLQRFRQNGRLLGNAHHRIALMAQGKIALTPDAEWLLDNFYIVQDVLLEVRQDLPRGYYRELPKLALGPLARYPRTYALALGLVAHTDSSLSEAHITRFVQAYQTAAPLTIGELWAVPTMLRLVLLENLRRLSTQMIRSWDDREQAERWLERHLKSYNEGELPPLCLPESDPLKDPFCMRLLQMLRDLGPRAGACLQQVEADLSARNLLVNEVLRREHQRQAVNQVSVGNCVTSLRLLTALDWNIFFETTSLVESILQDDPAGAYPGQDFATRDRYRQAVEKMAKRSRHTELEVAEQVVGLARQGIEAVGGEEEAAQGHIGYYLVGPGQHGLRARIGYRPGLRERLVEGILAHPHAVYFGTMTVCTGLLLALLALLIRSVAGAAAVAEAGVGLWVLTFLAALLPVSEVAIGLVNYLVTMLVPPRVLPKLAFKEGIPEDCATFVVMPCMLVRPESARVLLEKLEVHYLANPDPQLRFALLTDFADAPSENRPEDEGYVRAALEGVKALNERYAAGGPDRFFVFHRSRGWNPVQDCWMGWERKRGKLVEFNRLLRGAQDTSYAVCSGDPAELPHIRFVITLDVDTQLPREAARRLVGTLAHPLNRARFDPAEGHVVEGYGVLQPRVSFHMVAASRSLFARTWVGSAGIDPYSTAVSDVYQDLFGAGTFTGKGIYDVDAFEAATGHTFPENSILSHDLIEGNFARCGLVTDIELFDDFPARYHTYARREHRWIRGDWQLLPWLGADVPIHPDHPAAIEDRGSSDQQNGKAEEERSSDPRSSILDPRSSAERAPAGRIPNPLPGLERWKVFDNLRRSLVPPALLLMLLLGWTVLPGSAWLWTAIAGVVLCLPILLQVLGSAVQSVRRLSLTPLADLRRGVVCTAGQVTLSAVFLADQARNAVDAIVRTLARLSVSRRRLLEWETAASTERRLGAGLWSCCMCTWPSAGLAILFGATVWLVHPEALAAASPLLGAWLLAPLVAFVLSRERRGKEPAPLTEAERCELRRVARRTWSFFETFVTEADHWLPPDNFQEEPRAQVAHRTSPTNKGLMLLSTLAAHDLGYLSLRTLLDRLEKSFDTLERLERFRGHFYNWYDTQTLHPLQPGYVSTVDSGNLLGCLVTLRQGLLEKGQEPLIGASFSAGLGDTLGVLAELAQLAKSPAQSSPAEEHRRLLAALEEFRQRTETAPEDLPGWHALVGELTLKAEALAEQARRLVGGGVEAPGLVEWARRLADQVRDRQEELLMVAPWLGLPDAEADEGVRKLAGVPSLAELEPSKEALASARDTSPSVEVKSLENDGSPLAAEAQLRSAASQLLGRCRRLAERAAALADAMDFRFLYKSDRHLFAIGYNHGTGRLDTPSYDLLASESCLTSFLAIARGDVPPRHWFQLGRLLTRVDHRLCLISWGGTMFEYLMPPLLLRYYGGTLLDESRSAAVARQIEYGRQMGVPWGISESAFSSQFVSLDYQYQSFGVPGLGLKRGLGQDLVIAPYATALALPVRPHVALLNLRRLAAEGALGQYGYYESVDFTRERLPEGRRFLIVKCFMAHHQGMSLVALANGLLDGLMPRRFHAEPMVRATELLLQERLPTVVRLIGTQETEQAARTAGQEGGGLMSRRLTTPLTPGPRTHLLSNGRYNVMVTNAGSGLSTCSGLDVTRWREDATRDLWGQFCYVRDVRSGQVWSAAYQPLCRAAEEYEVIYSADKAEFRRVDSGIETRTEVVVSPENSAEIRRVTLANHGSRPRDMELTSYAEVVLAPHGADQGHPAFGKLFLETEWVPAHHALLCRRRPRAQDQKPVWAVHILAVEGEQLGAIEYETDRARFLGRGRSPADPEALDPGAALNSTTGPVLDPVFSLRCRVRVPAGGSVSVTFSTGLAETREQALQLADQYHDPAAVLRVFDLAWAHSQVELRHLELSTESAHLYQRLASHLIYAGGALRAGRGIIAANREGVPGLWRHGISGDKPILLLRIRATDEIPLVQQLLVAHAYWRLKGLEVDLVILLEDPTSYLEDLFHQVQNLIRSSDSHALVDKPGGLFLRKAAHFSEEDRTLLQAAARVVLAGNLGTLARQVERTEASVDLPPLLTVKERKKEPRRTADADPAPQLPELQFANGLGGFTPDGREYVIFPYAPAAADEPPGEPRRGFWRGERARRKTRAGLRLPPAPWINVLANPGFGALISESGSGYTWFGNSQLNRLTPWNNDPVSDPPGEVLYLRDDATGEFWTPTPRPLGAGAATVVRHGQGYTLFEQRARGLAQELVVFVPADAPVKVVRLRVRNVGDAPRRLSATYYAEWVLGTQRDQSPMRVVTELDADTGALLARNPFNPDIPAQVAFLDVNLRPRTLTGDRGEFLGRNGSPTSPAALSRVELSGRVGTALDPCCAVQAAFELQPQEQKEIIFVLGAAGSREEVRQHLTRFRDGARVQEALDEVKRLWDGVLGAVQVRTPDAALDVVVNRWLLYQALSCRVWGRSALYQSGGAYGFRDQLQDVMALVYGAPGETRAQILRAASRQFLEGDVQHWWHPPLGRGVRTRISDDYLWLPYVVSHYVATTGDGSVLDERVPFLTASLLKPDQEEDYGLPEVSGEEGTVYEHCLRALKHGLRFGANGLPLMGTGDWNDGMNRVGSEGRGESVWNGWFLLACLHRFGEVAGQRGDEATMALCQENAERLKKAIEENAWDGHWYLRAWFDDGTPLGSARNDECRIDAIAQSWAVLSGGGDPERAREAMREVWERLVRTDDGLILLFTPPFDKGKLQPGYIKGYVPGIRENGGQYTHAATWTVLATALLGDGTRGVSLFDLLNPVNHARTPEEVARYKVEPYVVAADVYGEPPHTGRGGWTWYTGSASWLYRVALEGILGFRLRGETLTLDPHIARDWPGFEVVYRHRSATYRIAVDNPGQVEGGVKEVWVDGQAQEGRIIRLADDGGEHAVRVVLG
jgi:cyclic beta-1,2-glucan synthetase